MFRYTSLRLRRVIRLIRLSTTANTRSISTPPLTQPATQPR